jgi:hypothetical protein
MDGAEDLSVEIHEAGGVREDELIRFVAERIGRRKAVGENCDFPIFLLIRRVGDAGTIGDQAQTVVQSQLKGNGIGEGGLSASAMSENDEIPDV